MQGQRMRQLAHLPLPFFFLVLGIFAQTKVELGQKSANTRPVFIVLSRKMKIFPWHSRKKGVESDLGNSQLAETIHFPSSTGAARGKGGSEYLYRQTCHEEVSRHRRPIREQEQVSRVFARDADTIRTCAPTLYVAHVFANRSKFRQLYKIIDILYEA